MNVHVKTIDVHHLKQHYENNSELLLIDVREHDEWLDMHIPRAHHMPLNEIVAHIKMLAPMLHQTIYLHCRSGVRSKTAALSLMQQGYTQVYSVDGGINAWAQANYPVVI